MNVTYYLVNFTFLKNGPMNHKYLVFNFNTENNFNFSINNPFKLNINFDFLNSNFISKYIARFFEFEEISSLYFFIPFNFLIKYCENN